MSFVFRQFAQPSADDFDCSRRQQVFIFLIAHTGNLIMPSVSNAQGKQFICVRDDEVKLHYSMKWLPTPSRKPLWIKSSTKCRLLPERDK